MGISERRKRPLGTIAVIALLLFHFIDTTVPATTPLPPSTLVTEHGTLQSTTSSSSNDIGFSYDNKITGAPEIKCDYGVVHFKVFTEKGRASSVFVRGQSDKHDCVFHNTSNVTIELAKCNVRRKREITPSGVSYQMTVVVQLHPVGRAEVFWIQHSLFSELTTQTVMQDAQLPLCTYSVHRDSPNGPMVKYTRVGEQLYHVWECPSKMYSMLLYNCSAIDGKGSEYPIVDENGCSKDQFLMPQITYTADNTKAMAASAAFNFPDRNTMSFTCKIRLCFVSECKNVTPPQCKETFLVEQQAASTLTPSSSLSVASSTLPPSLNQDIDLGVGSTRKSGEHSSNPLHRPLEFSTSGESSGLVVTREYTTVASPRGGGPSSIELFNSRESTASTFNPSPTFSSAGITTREDSVSSTWPSIRDTTPLADDFPRPANFLQAIQDSSTEVNFDEVDRTTPSSVSSTGGTDSIQQLKETNESIQTTTPRLIILKDTTVATNGHATHPTSSAATAAANAKNSAAAAKAASANRQARDTTGTPEWDNKKGRPQFMRQSKLARTVDFDIASPELTIIDDYEESTSHLRDTPMSKFSDGLFGSHQGSGNKSLVCFSSAALICAGVLLALLAGAVIFLLFKAWHKSVHNFY